jgi:hypothetical protein
VRMLLAYAALGLGLAVSVWITPDRPITNLVLGAAAGFAGTALMPSRGDPGSGPDWGSFEATVCVGFFALMSLVCVGVVFGSDMLSVLATRRPGLAAAMTNTTGNLVGLTAYVAVNRKKLISR